MAFVCGKNRLLDGGVCNDVGCDFDGDVVMMTMVYGGKCKDFDDMMISIW